MAKRKGKAAKGDQVSATEPKFPYTTKPSSLRKLLKEIPNKPRPAKVDTNFLKSWGFRDSNDATLLRVLKGVNLLDDRGVPTDVYTAFMNLAIGTRALGPEVKRVYAPLFQASHTPYNESQETLKNLFNIHSGGGDRAIEYQISTFKALCENATFDATIPATGVTTNPLAPAVNASGVTVPVGTGAPAVNINLHIHLPENKTRRDYEDIIEDIARYIFGRNTGERRRD